VTVGQAIGQILPTAIGVAISPLPIVAVVLMLVTPRGRTNGPAFIVGWCAGLAVVGAIVISAAGSAGATQDGAPATWVNWLKLILGVLLLAVAARQWKARPEGSEEAATPKWMGALDGFTAVKALGAGVVLSALNPKNLLLAMAGGAVVAQAELSTGQEAATWLVFIVLASIGVAAPVVISIALGDRSREVLDRLKTWLARENTVIMAVMLLVIGVKLIGDAISGFSA
jgi:threonine/homoserine/homoserine lactone efflux protein